MLYNFRNVMQPEAGVNMQPHNALQSALFYDFLFVGRMCSVTWFNATLHFNIGMGIQHAIMSSLNQLWWKSWPHHAENIYLRFQFRIVVISCAVKSMVSFTF
jgi:hypothetical protein